MNIIIAKEIKAISLGYGSWSYLVATYNSSNTTDYIAKYEEEAMSFVMQGIPDKVLLLVEENLILQGIDFTKAFLSKIKSFENSTKETISKAQETIEYIKTL